MKCDLHIHTHLSYDSISLPKSIVKEAIKKGIDCLAITDHGKVKGYDEVKKFAKGKDLLIIKGIELKSKKGDIIGLNIKEKIPEGLTVNETIKRIKEQGGFVVVPHPFFKYYQFQGDLKGILNKIDAIEILNASISKEDNKKAQEFVKENDFPFTAGSDAHSSFIVGETYLEIPGHNLSIKEILKAIKNKKGEVKGREISFLNVIKDRGIRNIAKFLNFFEK